MPLQGGYVAKHCPVRAQNDTLQPAEPLPVSPILQRRFDRGIEFESDVVTELLTLHPEAVVIEGEDSGAREAATVQAMQAGAPVVLAGRLPSDATARRAGKPDVLLAAGGGGYHGVDIKHHRSMQAPAANPIPGRFSALDRPSLRDAAVDQDLAARKNKDDLLQLAHYQRMLQTAGFAADGACFGGIIGRERRVVWYDLDEQIWRTPSSTGKTKVRSTMDVYDFEFEFRLDIVAVAMRHQADPAVQPLVVPVRISECPTCPWLDYCNGILEAGHGDVSLLPRIGWPQWRIHRDHGVTDRAALAALDVHTAELIGDGVDLSLPLSLAAQLPAETPLAAIPAIRKRPKQLGLLEAAGMATLGELSGLCTTTATYSDAPMSSLATQIEMARAALGDAPVYRRRGVDAIQVPRGDVEVEVDMENMEEGVYLWGALVADPSGSLEQGYRPFAVWDPLTTQNESQNFLAFWRWLIELRDAARSSGRTFRAYCYHEPAENTQMRRIGRAAGIGADVDAFIDSQEWVDLRPVFERHLITGTGVGLKVVAPLAGFAWEVDDAGGQESMLRYDVAVGGATVKERAAAREWLLTYNRGDVEATAMLRDWLQKESASLPSITSLESRFRG
ncbi:MAG: TM0106 family RecB-like putative nuclease [Actinomycetota bacterium]